MRVALNQFYVTLASLCVTLASLWVTLASLWVTLVSFWGQRGATGRSERSSGDQSEKRSQCKGGAGRVQGGCKEGARRVQGGCREGAGRVQGGCREGAGRVQGGCKEVQGGCREGHFVHLGCSLEIFWVYEGYFESTLLRFVKLFIFPTEFNAFTYFPDRFSCFYTTMGLTWVHFGVTLG